MLKIGHHTLPNNVVVAPMAGVTDRPFRELCLDLGAAMAVSEMISDDPELAQSRKTRLRREHSPRAALRSVQIVGNDPERMAAAALRNAKDGADIIDINMGCPAKKVCKKAAGSALLGDEALVTAILEAVVSTVSVPVTLKIRTGLDRSRRNGVRIAKIAEDAGVQMLAVHGRTRADKFAGDAEYHTIEQIVDAVTIPVLANGDINSITRARRVLETTGAAGVMIGRGAQGQPWLPGMIARALRGQSTAAPSPETQVQIIQGHLLELIAFYGEFMGTKIARKHVGWFADGWFTNEPTTARRWKQQFNRLDHYKDQLEHLAHIQHFNHRTPRIISLAA
ncbi:tRNA dihydrouridine synthase DusB [Luminiphilus syltensis]|nr:tRNA dihydrouridine synthase DusB [Luminiphilus syltensis]